MKNFILVALACFTMSSCGNFNLGDLGGVLGTSTGSPTNNEIIGGLKQALEIGVLKGATTVSKPDGFFKNPNIKIPLPQDLRKVESKLRNIGLGPQVDKILLTINRGAEDAAKGAKNIFISAIKQMTIQDAMSILKGEPNAATNFLRRTTTTQLEKAFRPVVNKSLGKVQATKHWTDVTSKYNKIPFVKPIETDLTGYVTTKAVEGLFFMIEKEEAKIRKDPLARTTDLLKKVFKLQDR